MPMAELADHRCRRPRNQPGSVWRRIPAPTAADSNCRSLKIKSLRRSQLDPAAPQREIGDCIPEVPYRGCKCTGKWTRDKSLINGQASLQSRFSATVSVIFALCEKRNPKAGN